MSASKSRAAFLALLLATTTMASLFAMPVAAADNGWVRFQDADERNITSTQVVGYGATAFIKVHDKDLTEPTVNVVVTSNSDTAGEEITLQRVERRGGNVYIGYVGFEASRIARNGEVFVQDDDTVSVVYIDNADNTGAAAARQDIITWAAGADGTINLDSAAYFGSAASVEVQVVDGDIPATSNTFDVVAKSEKGNDEVLVTLNQVVDGVYEGLFSIETATDADPSLLYVKEGDTITVEYKNKGFDLKGHDELPSATATWDASYNGRVQFTNKAYTKVYSEMTTCPCPSVYGKEDGSAVDKAGAWIRVEDRDLEGKGTITVNVRSTNTANTDVDPTGINVELTETGTNTGEFHGQIGFKTGGPSTGKQLRVTDGATVEVRYLDANGETGDEFVRSAKVTWRDVVLRFVTSNTTTPAATTYDASTSGAKGFIYLKDSSAAGSAKVAVRLTSTVDQVGIDVSLTETAANSGVFRSAFNFSATGSKSTNAGGPTIWAEGGTTAGTAGDKLSLWYHTQSRRDAGQGPIEVKDAVSITNPVKARPTVAPTETDLKIVTSSTSTTAMTSLTGASTIHVYAKDKVKGAANASLSIVAWTSSNRAGWDATQLLMAGNGQSKSVAESATADVYRTSFQVSSTQPTASHVVPKDGDMVCVAMLVKNAAGVNARVQSHCVPFTTAKATKTATIQFRDDDRGGAVIGDTKAFNGLTTAYVFVQDLDATADAKSTQEEVEVRITSEADTTGIKIKLKERYGRHTLTPSGVQDAGDLGFIGSFEFTTGASGAGKLKVAHRDTISVFYDDPKDAAGSAATVVAQTKWNRTYDGEVSIDRSLVRATNNPSDAANEVTITVKDKDRDVSVARESVVVSVKNETTGQISVTLTETTATSGIFTGKFRFHRAELGGTPPAGSLPIADVEDFTVVYDEATNAKGKAVSHKVTGTWFDVNAARVTWNNATYTTTGAVATITVEDPDRDATNTVGTDNFRAWVTSDSDGAGRWIIFEEASAKSGGLFFGTVGFTGSRTESAQSNKIAVSDGDRITVHYFDAERSGDNVAGLTEGRGRTVHATWETAANQAPEATVKVGTNAANTDVTGIEKNTTLEFFVTALDSDGTIASWKLSFGDGTANVTGTGSPPTGATAHTYADDGIYQVRFQATDDDGAVGVGELKVFVGQGDNEAPGAPAGLKVTAIGTTTVKLEFTAPDGNGVAKDKQAISAYTIKHAAKITSQAEFDAATSVSSAKLTFDPVALAAPGSKQTVTVSGLTKNTEYTFAVQAKDAVGNAGVYATVAGVKTLEKDNTAPTGALTVSSSHAAGSTSDTNTIDFSWTSVTDAESAVKYHFVLNKVASYTVSGQEPTTTSDTKTTFNAQPDGKYYFHVAACSEGGCGATATYGPITIATDVAPALDEAAITDANKQVGVTVLRSGSDNVVRWTIPSSTPQPVVGVQIWSSNSPWNLLVTIDKENPAFAAGEYTHVGAPAGTKYQVTLFYGKEPGQGFAASPDGVPGFDTLGDGSTAPAPEGGLSGLVIGLIVAGAILLIALVVGLVLALRPKKDDEFEGEEGMAWSAPEEEQSWGGDTWNEGETWGDAPYEDAGPEDADGGAYESDAYASEQAYEEPAYEEAYEQPAYEAPPIAPVPEPAPVDPHTHHLTCPSCDSKFTAYGPKPLVTECPSCGVRGILR